MKPGTSLIQPLFRTALTLLGSLLVVGWTNELTAKPSSEEVRVLENDSLSMRGHYEKSMAAAGRGHMPVDLGDESQYRFVLNRLRAAGKTEFNSPYLFQRLQAQREQELAKKAAGLGEWSVQGDMESLSTPSGWWCDHFLLLTREVANVGSSTYFSNPSGSCKGGATYAYIDVAAYDSNLEGTAASLLQFQGMEQYNGGTNLNGLEVQPTLSTTGNRVAVFDSMMVAENANTGEAIVSYSLRGSTALPVPPQVGLSHPRRAPGSTLNDVLLCQLRGGSDCDYAVVSPTYQPYTAPMTGVALRQGAYPWNGDPAQYFSMDAAYDYNRLYVPLEFTFDSGSTGGGQCSLVGFSDSTSVRLIKTQSGGSCSVTVRLKDKLNQILATLPANSRRTITYRALEDFSRLLNPDQNPCTTPSITNEAVNLLITVTAQANCGGVVVPRARTYSLRLAQNRNLFFLNSCMAAGTRVVRADGTSGVVEEIRVGDKVLAGGKQVLTVTDVAHGGEAEPLVLLKDNHGHEVSLTAQHPVMLASGQAVAAARLEPGAKVHTRRGVATLVSVTRVPYTGHVYNLTLGTREELARVGDQGRTMFANGFLVGDNAMQALLSAPPSRPEATLANLPKVWHRDYLMAGGAWKN